MVDDLAQRTRGAFAVTAHQINKLGLNRNQRGYLRPMVMLIASIVGFWLPIALSLLCLTETGEPSSSPFCIAVAFLVLIALVGAFYLGLLFSIQKINKTIQSAANPDDRPTDPPANPIDRLIIWTHRFPILFGTLIVTVGIISIFGIYLIPIVLLVMNLDRWASGLSRLLDRAAGDQHVFQKKFRGSALVVALGLIVLGLIFQIAGGLVSGLS